MRVGLCFTGSANSEIMVGMLPQTSTGNASGICALGGGGSNASDVHDYLRGLCRLKPLRISKIQGRKDGILTRISATTGDHGRCRRGTHDD